MAVDTPEEHSGALTQPVGCSGIKPIGARQSIYMGFFAAPLFLRRVGLSMRGLYTGFEFEAWMCGLSRSLRTLASLLGSLG